MLCKQSFLALLASSLVAGLSYDNIDKAATPRARELLKYIQSQYGSHYLSGQQEPESLKWVQQNFGVTPAILGTDLMYYSPTAVANGAKSQTVEDAISFGEQGGINALVWHWYPPTCVPDTEEKPWYDSFYTKSTCFNLANALGQGSNGTATASPSASPSVSPSASASASPSGSASPSASPSAAANGNEYGLLIRDIDAIAHQLKRLDEADVPVLFRPLHEPEGAWFWWGAQGPAPFKQLWDLIYDRITRVHNIHNLVWVCNTADPNWYPGNDKCDIATVDHYAEAGDHGALEGKYQSLKQVTQGERVLALAEVGSIPDPEEQASKSIPWAFWMTWNDEFIKDGKHNSREFLKSTFSNPRVVTMGNGTTRH